MGKTGSPEYTEDLLMGTPGPLLLLKVSDTCGSVLVWGYLWPVVSVVGLEGRVCSAGQERILPSLEVEQP